MPATSGRRSRGRRPRAHLRPRPRPRRTYHTLEHRDKAIRELVDLSQEVAQTHELSRFVERFALRLMAAVNADCVDVYRVSGGVIRSLISLSREGVDAARYDTILDTAKYPSLERTLIDQTPLAIDSLSDPRLSPAEVADVPRVGLRQLAHHAPRRRRRHRRARGPLRRRRARWGPDVGFSPA